MAFDKEKLKKLQDRFRERMTESVRPFPVGALEEAKGICEPDEVWYIKDATGQQSDKILKAARDGGVFASYVEAMIWRLVDEENRQLFPEAMRPELFKVEPALVYKVANEMRLLDDVDPDIKNIQGNSSATQSQKPDST